MRKNGHFGAATATIAATFALSTLSIAKRARGISANRWTVRPAMRQLITLEAMVFACLSTLHCKVNRVSIHDLSLCAPLGWVARKLLAGLGLF